MSTHIIVFLVGKTGKSFTVCDLYVAILTTAVADNCRVFEWSRVRARDRRITQEHQLSASACAALQHARFAHDAVACVRWHGARTYSNRHKRYDSQTADGTDERMSSCVTSFMRWVCARVCGECLVCGVCGVCGAWKRAPMALTSSVGRMAMRLRERRYGTNTNLPFTKNRGISRNIC